MRSYQNLAQWLDDIKEMIIIPAGEFVMGGENGFDDERPAHRVYLDTYYIDRCPVTNAEYKRFLDANPQHRVPYVEEDWARPYNWDEQARAYPSGRENHPVVLVSWDDAVAYAEWTGKRLPTEAEWEKAARGTDDRRYPWGGDWGKRRCNAHEGDIGGTTPVGQYSPRGDSPYGVADMAGNVWEWVADWYDGDYYANSPARNPTGPSSGNTKGARGGAWNYFVSYARSAFRYFYYPSCRYKDVGFRCVQDAQADKTPMHLKVDFNNTCDLHESMVFMIIMYIYGLLFGIIIGRCL